MLTAVTNGLSTVIGWCGTVISSITTEAGELGELLPLFAIGVSISVIFLGVKVVKSIIWGA